MNLQGAFTFWNPWWSGERNWFQAVDRELLPDLKELLVRKEVLTYLSGLYFRKMFLTVISFI
jgi:hypothetical protein